MLKRFFVLLLPFLFAGVTFAQFYGFESDQSEMDAGLGMAFIEGESYFAFTLYPDISIGKVGIGLGVNLLYNTETGKIRSTDWDSGYDWARIIRYIRYGHKGDAFYTRVGALDAERLGHGFILNYYNNQLNYDERKLGLVLDADFGSFGFESLTNNLGRTEVLGFRGYYRPLYQSAIPVFKRLAVGGSFVTDRDPDAWTETDETVSVWGLDVELPLIRSSLLNMVLYADHAKINSYGSGQAIGLMTHFSALWDWLALSVNVERRFLGKEFVGSFYDPFYEMYRYTTYDDLVDYFESLGGSQDGIPEDLKAQTDETQLHLSKHQLLPMITEKQRGWYGALLFDFFHLVKAVGSYQKIDKLDNSGILHIGAGLSQNVPIFDIEAAYDKRGIEKSKDVFTLDDRSVARIGIGYKLKPYLLLYMDYIWNFEYNENMGRYESQKRFQPRIAFRYPFNL